jgi:hypothetical protein
LTADLTDFTDDTDFLDAGPLLFPQYLFWDLAGLVMNFILAYSSCWVLNGFLFKKGQAIFLIGNIQISAH